MNRYNRVLRHRRDDGIAVFHREAEEEGMPVLVIRIPYTIEPIDYCDSTYLSVDLDSTHLHLMTEKEAEQVRDDVLENHVWPEPPEY